MFEVIRSWLPTGARRISLLTHDEPSSAALTFAAEMEVDVLRGASADAAIDSGYDLLIVADAAPPVAALGVIAAYTRKDASRVMPPMDDDAEWMTLAGAVRDRIRELRPHLVEFDHILAGDDMTSISAMYTMMTTAARRGVPVLFNGVGACAAALITDRYLYTARESMLCADALALPSVTETLDRIGIPALATFEIPDAHLGALLAVPILRAAALTS